MEKISRMAAEVNKLVGSSLLSGDSVYIPQSGSLSVIEDEQGVKSVSLDGGEQGESLIEIIRKRASCTEEQASEIFRRWREEVGSNVALIVKGVGEINASGFIIDERFAARLNPNVAAKPVAITTATTAATVTAATATASVATEATTAATPTPTPTKATAEAPKKNIQKPTRSKKRHSMKQKKKSRKGIIIIIVLLLIALAGFFAYTHIAEVNAEKAQIEAIAQRKAEEQRREADSIARAQAEAKRQAEAEAAAAAAVPPRYRLVYGIYELRSNVDVAIALINKRHGEGSAKEYPFGARTMVSIIESDDRSVCQSFLMNNYDIYHDSWVYDSQQ